MSHRLLFVTTALLSGSLFGQAVLAADLYVTGNPVEPVVLPAVSGINGKLGKSGGVYDSEAFGFVTGTLSVPVGHRYGLQIDGELGVYDEEFAGGAAAHLFWRDPKYGLLGVYGSHSYYDAFDGGLSRIGVEGEYYYNNFTFSGLYGAEFIDTDLPQVDETNLFAFTDLSYYAQDDLKLTVGHRFTGDSNAVSLGVEYQLTQNIVSSGVSLFAEGRLGDDDYKAIWGGVRFYLGDEKSLKRRHREDDPGPKHEDNLFGILNAAGNCSPDAVLAAPGAGHGDNSEGYNTCTGVSAAAGV